MGRCNALREPFPAPLDSTSRRLSGAGPLRPMSARSELHACLMNRSLAPHSIRSALPLNVIYSEYINSNGTLLRCPSPRIDTAETPLCRFAFKDGRHSTLPAHRDDDGLCYSHGTFARRASRGDNLHHILEPLAHGRSSAKAHKRALRDQWARVAGEPSFTSRTGPAWNRLGHAVAFAQLQKGVMLQLFNRPLATNPSPLRL